MATIKKNTANNTEMKESWNTIRGAMRVFVKCFDNGTSISVGIGKKDGETWTNFYLPVYVSQSCKIELKEGLNLPNNWNPVHNVTVVTHCPEAARPIIPE